MRKVPVTAIAAMGLSGAAIAACQAGDSRCTVEGCQIFVSCGARLAGEIDETCAPIADDAGFDFADAAVQSCLGVFNAYGAGAAVQCVAEHFPDDTCAAISADGGNLNMAVTDACGGDAGIACGSNCMLCQQRCYTTANTCNETCLIPDAGACFACNDDCNRQLVTCLRTCPTN
jgi:hypothetical protein